MIFSKGQTKSLYEALLDSFSHDELRRMVRYELDTDLEAIVSNNNMNNTVFDLIEWAGRQGRLTELINGAVQTNSGNLKLQAWVQNNLSISPGHAAKTDDSQPVQSRNLDKVEQYESFESIIGHKNSEGYPITIKGAPSGDAEAISQLDLSAPEIQDIIWNLRNLDATQDSFMKIGKYLFENLFVNEVENCYRTSINRTQAQDKRLRLCLYIQSPELAALPWEYLYDDMANGFLAIDPRISLTRYIPLPNPPNTVQIELPLRILVVISNPSNITALDLNKERSIIEDALTDAQRKNQVRLHFVEHATIANINQAMRQFKPHIFHFVGHSSSQENETVILLVDDMNQAKIVSDNVFSKFFSISQETYLVVLNSGESGVISTTQRPAGIPYHVSQLGVPAVIAMQYPMPNEASYIFAREFYRTLAIERTVEVAIAEARKVLYQERNGQSCEWGIPAFFLSSRE